MQKINERAVLARQVAEWEAEITRLFNLIATAKGAGVANEPEPIRSNLIEAEVAAWRARFPRYIYRPQDDCVSLAR